MVGVKDTISVFDMTDEEIDNYWLSDEEYQYIRRRNRLLIKRAELFESFQGKALPACHSECYEDLEDDIETKACGDFLCVRGLESGTRKENIRKKTYRRNSIQQVLLEQELQSGQCCRDEEATMRRFYATQSGAHCGWLRLQAGAEWKAPRRASLSDEAPCMM